MAGLKKFFRAVLRYFDVPLIIALVALPSYIPTLVAQQGEGFRDIDLPKATVRCLSGLCFLKRQENAVIEYLRPPESRSAFIGDTAVTLDEGTEMEVLFPDGGKLLLRKTSLLRIEPGRGSLLQDLDRSAPGYDGGDDETEEAKNKQVPASIIYVGTLPIEVLYPAADSELIAREFPLSLRVAFRLAKRLLKSGSHKEEDVRRWQLYADPKSGGRKLGLVNFEAPGSSDVYYADVQITEPGFYLLIPEGLKADSSTGSIGFRVLASDAMADKVRELLDRVEEDGTGEIEIRQ